MKRIKVLGDASEFPNCELLICTLGYENRSAHLARSFHVQAKEKCALYFGDRQEASFPANKAFYEQAGFELIPFNDDMEDHLSAFLRRTGEGALSVVVDISSMSRPMMARVVNLLRSSEGRNIDATFFYCPAVFAQPSSEPSLITVSEPVIPELAGWTDEPTKAVAAVVGLGYEFDQALGTLENLEPAAAWAFMPHGEDQRYEAAVEEANKDFFSLLTGAHITRYLVSRPFDCFQTLEGMSYGLLAENRLILIPFGPKIFALICIIIAFIYERQITVWRVSGDQRSEPADRVASGRMFGLNISFEAAND